MFSNIFTKNVVWWKTIHNFGRVGDKVNLEFRGGGGFEVFITLGDGGCFKKFRIGGRGMVVRGKLPSS